MIPKQTEDIKSSGLGDKHKAYMKSDNIIYELLTSTMYSDPLGTMIQEYIQNGIDEHIRLGKPEVPVEITMPTREEPQLTIKDQGRGLSFEGIHKVFCGYGESDKQSTNALVGGFGMGAKSGLGYCDSYVVKSIKNCVETTAIIAKDEDGIPFATCTSTKPSNEPNGTSIILPIKLSDFDDLAAKYNIKTCFFNPKPKITNTHEETAKLVDEQNQYEPEELINLKTGKTYKHGTIPSSVNNGHILIKHSLYRLPEEWKNDFELCFAEIGTLILEMETGEVDINPNREQIRATTRTKDAIRKKYEIAEKELEKKIGEMVNAKEPWPIISQISELPHGMLTNDMRRKQIDAYDSIRKIQNEFEHAGVRVKEIQTKAWWRHDGRKQLSEETLWKRGSGPVFFILPTKDCPKTKAAKILRANPHRKLEVKIGTETHQKNYFIEGEVEKAEEFLKEIGAEKDKILYIDEIYPDEAEKAKRAEVGKRSPAKIKILDTREPTNSREASSEEIEETTLYIHPKEVTASSASMVQKVINENEVAGTKHKYCTIIPIAKKDLVPKYAVHFEEAYKKACKLRDELNKRKREAIKKNKKQIIKIRAWEQSKLKLLHDNLKDVDKLRLLPKKYRGPKTPTYKFGGKEYRVPTHHWEIWRDLTQEEKAEIERTKDEYQRMLNELLKEKPKLRNLWKKPLTLEDIKHLL